MLTGYRRDLSMVSCNRSVVHYDLLDTNIQVFKIKLNSIQSNYKNP